MGKLVNHGVLKKKKGKSFYIVTPEGQKWSHVSIAAILKFSNPIISIPWKREAKKLVKQPSQIEAEYQAIHQGFNQLAQALALG